MTKRIRLEQVDGMFEDEYLVAHDYSHQRDEAEDGGETQVAVHQSQANERTWYHQSQGCHTDCSNTIFLEIEKQEEENDDQGNDDAAENLRQGLISIFDLTANFRTYALW